MIDQKLARLRTHRNNINRYRRLLKTPLTDFERGFIERRMTEEQSAFESFAAGVPSPPREPSAARSRLVS